MPAPSMAGREGEEDDLDKRAGKRVSRQFPPSVGSPATGSIKGLQVCTVGERVRMGMGMVGKRTEQKFATSQYHRSKGLRSEEPATAVAG